MRHRKTSKTLIEEFEDALKKGTGKAYLLVKSNPRVDFSKQIFRACIHYLDYDPICSCSRALSLYEMIKLTINPEKLKTKLIAVFRGRKGVYLSCPQLDELMMLFARDGNSLARQVLYERFEKHVKAGEGYVAADEIVQLDRLDGLIHVAGMKGKYFLQHANGWENCDALSYLQKYFRKTDLKQFLEQTAVKDRYIRAYLQAIKKSCKERDAWRKKSRKLNCSKVMRMVDAKQRIPFTWAQVASKKAIKVLASRLDVETDKKKIELILSFFSLRKFPLDHRILIKLAKTGNERVRRCALCALEFFRDDEVREFALQNLRKKKDVGNSLQLLVRNFKDSDYSLIEKLLRSETDRDKFHHMGLAVGSIFNKHGGKRCLKSLMMIYERGYCALCRADIVAIMMRNKVMPKRIVSEAIYDCNLAIRRRVRRYITPAERTN